MNFKIHTIGDIDIVELISKKIEINDLDDAADLLGGVHYLEAKKVIIKKAHLAPAFFNLKNKFAEDVQKKFSTYDMQLAIIGDFSKNTHKDFYDFIGQSNNTGHLLFLPSLEVALEKLGKF